MKGMMRNLILFVIIGGILAGGFYYFFNKNTPVESNITSTNSNLPNTENTVSSEKKQSISGINLDTAIFSNPAFLSLRDSSVILIPRGNEGRPNPFAPIGIDNIANTGSLNSFNNSTDIQEDNSLNDISNALTDTEEKTTN